MMGALVGWGLVALGIGLFIVPPSTAQQRVAMMPSWLALPLVGLQIWAGNKSGSEDRPIPTWVLIVDGLVVVAMTTIGHVRQWRKADRT